MLSTTLLATRISNDFPHLQLEASNECKWLPASNTIRYDPREEPAHLLHELSHALLEHAAYQRDITLLEMERDAWEHAKKQAINYNFSINETLIQDALDTYRDWLHSRSICPDCSATGIQTKKYQYKCFACGATWKVNDARICALRRYKISAN